MQLAKAQRLGAAASAVAHAQPAARPALQPQYKLQPGGPPQTEIQQIAAQIQQIQAASGQMQIQHQMQIQQHQAAPSPPTMTKQGSGSQMHGGAIQNGQNQQMHDPIQAGSPMHYGSPMQQMSRIKAGSQEYSGSQVYNALCTQPEFQLFSASQNDAPPQMQAVAQRLQAMYTPEQLWSLFVHLQAQMAARYPKLEEDQSSIPGSSPPLLSSSTATPDATPARTPESVTSDTMSTHSDPQSPIYPISPIGPDDLDLQPLEIDLSAQGSDPSCEPTPESSAYTSSPEFAALTAPFEYDGPVDAAPAVKPEFVTCPNQAEVSIFYSDTLPPWLVDPVVPPLCEPDAVAGMPLPPLPSDSCGKDGFSMFAPNSDFCGLDDSVFKQVDPL
eukprot:TRINITY_DN532_c0_g3_i6.p1 TRINITY_DN532_c0_g3~~TRINITY_DN532_c0_g3_i6.p1  ORF type:complete len:386 (+),score=148.75 TRINITY_DN532_c0_g3_i6:99-1256(+)